MKKGNVGWIVIGWIILSIVIAVSVGGDNVTQTFFIVGIGGSAALLIIIGVKDWTSKKQKQQIEEEERERNLLAKDKENQQIRNDYNILNENPSVNILVKGFLSNYGFEMMQPIESFLSIDMYFLSQDNDYCKYIYTEYGDIHRYITSSAIYDIEGYLPEDFIKLTKGLIV